MRHGRVRRARLGIVCEQVALSQRLRNALGLTQTTGARIASLSLGGAAEKGGLRIGDVVVGLEDREVVSGIDDLARLLDANLIGRSIEVAYVRGDALTAVNAEPGERG